MKNSLEKDRLNFFDSFYFQLNRILLEIVGLWPYQNTARKWLRRCFFMFMITSITPLMILHFIEEVKKKSIDASIECISVLAYFFSCILKLVCSVISEKQRKYIFDGMCEDWEIINDKDEVEELKRMSLNGRRLTLFYFIYMQIAVFAYIGFPFVPQMLDVINPLNESRPRLLLIQARYFVDTDVYYYHIVSYTIGTCLCSGILFITTDSTYMYCVKHLCARFTIVELRLMKSLKADTLSSKNQADRKDIYNDVIKAIISHQKAIEFVELIESSYFMNFLFMIGFAIVAISGTALRFLLNSGNYFEMLRIGMFNLGQMIHLYWHSWPGQQVMDCSTNIFRSAYICNWTSASKQTKQLLCILMLRSLIPCQLTAGKLYVMSMENFSSVLKTTISYFTLLASLR